MTAHRALLVHGLWSSPRTWWRVASLLRARGWDVETATLPGHGGHPLGSMPSMATFAEDVVAHHRGGPRLIVGHSFGAVVALQVAATHPAYAAGVLLEDPPGRGRVRTADARADDLVRETEAARSDPDGVIGSLLAGHPTWTRRDARSVVEGRLLTDPGLAQLSPRALTWDLPALVRTCPVPVGLLASTGRYSALAEPQRSVLIELLPPDRVTQVDGSHHLHLDDPPRWAEVVHTFGRSLDRSGRPG